MTSVAEVQRVRDAVRGFGGASDIGRSFADGLLGNLVVKLREDEQRAELEAFGADVAKAAEAGWNALRVKNPKVDRSTGKFDDDIQAFSDLPHKLKLNYLTFAQGALSPFEVAEEAPAEPEAVQSFESGQRVKIVKDPISHEDGRPVAGLSLGDVVMISGGTPDVDGDLYVLTDEGRYKWVRSSCVALVDEATPTFEVGDRVKVTDTPKTAGGSDRTWRTGVGAVGTVTEGIDQDGDIRIDTGSGAFYIDAARVTKLDTDPLEVGDRVRVTGELRTIMGAWVDPMIAQRYCEVLEVGISGSLRVRDMSDASLAQWIDPASLTKVPKVNLGDRVKITVRRSVNGSLQSVDSDYGIVRGFMSSGSVRVHTGDGAGIEAFIAPENLELAPITPRVFQRLEDIPASVTKVKMGNQIGSPIAVRNSEKSTGWECTCPSSSPHPAHNFDGPFTEVLND